MASIEEAAKPTAHGDESVQEAADTLTGDSAGSAEQQGELASEEAWATEAHGDSALEGPSFDSTQAQAAEAFVQHEEHTAEEAPAAVWSREDHEAAEAPAQFDKSSSEEVPAVEVKDFSAEVSAKHEETVADEGVPHAIWREEAAEEIAQQKKSAMGEVPVVHIADPTADLLAQHEEHLPEDTLANQADDQSAEFSPEEDEQASVGGSDAHSNSPEVEFTDEQRGRAIDATRGKLQQVELPSAEEDQPARPVPQQLRRLPSPTEEVLARSNSQAQEYPTEQEVHAIEEVPTRRPANRLSRRLPTTMEDVPVAQNHEAVLAVPLKEHVPTAPAKNQMGESLSEQEHSVESVEYSMGDGKMQDETVALTIDPTIVGKFAAMPARISNFAGQGKTRFQSAVPRMSALETDIGVPQRKSRATIFAEDTIPLEQNTALAQGAVQYDLSQKLLAECMGTFFLALTVGLSAGSSHEYTPLAIGFVLAIQIYTFGKISGGLFNPAVTLAVLLCGRKKLKLSHGLAYMAAQCCGAVIAGFIAFANTPDSFFFDWAQVGGNAGTSFVIELLYTAALCNTVLGAGTSWDAPNDYFGFAIGSTLTASAYACSGRDQGSFNPAVTLGINLASYAKKSPRGDFSGPSGGAWVVYLLAPFLGGAMAAFLFRMVRSREFLPLLGSEEEPPPALVEKLIAEFTGTFYLVFTVGLAATAAGSSQAPVATGLMLAAQVYTYAAVSGGLFNPAVAFAVMLSGRDKLPPTDFGLYVGVECLGAILAGLFAEVAGEKSFGFTEQALAGGNAGSSFMLELLLTFALCSTVLNTGTSKDAPNQYFGFAIGGTVLASAFACRHLDQGSFNPAVTLGINLANYAGLTETFKPPAESWFLFLLTPFLGGALAAGIFWVTRLQEVEETREANE
eukprot:TRINITY_DN12443_c0_g1_i1.p1 TRINITY_DN12443_c0_g1~~TRINITY_DN12443_c0_g1_i1.p1  ORF type:complete len:905 (+),score=189.54 TRINITY_DN12443_c0_g1_i1:44-2758(+)